MEKKDSSSIAAMVKKHFESVSALLKKQKIVKIGFDFGSFSLKIVVLEPQDNRYLLKDVKIFKLPSGEDINLRALVKGMDLSSGVNLGICGPDVAVRYVIMTKMIEDDFKRSLRYEAASHLPFKIDDLNLDGAILKELPDNQMMVMFAAAKKDFVTQQLKLLKEANIKVNVLDVDSLALINAFNYTYHRTTKDLSLEQQANKAPAEPDKKRDVSSGAVVLLNIGFSVTSINILEDGIPHFSRDINIAGKEFINQGTQEVAISNLLSEVRKSFDYYEAGSAAVINNIFLSGAGSLLSGLSNKLETALGVKTMNFNPFRNFDFDPALDKSSDIIMKNSSQFAVAVGLALR